MDGFPSFFWDVFAVTPPMPTYLVAVAVCAYESVPAEASAHNQTLSVWGPPDRIARGDGTYAAWIAPRIYDRLVDVLGEKVEGERKRE